MGHVHLTHHQRGAGHNRPQNLVGGAPRETAGAGPSPRRGTLEIADQTSHDQTKLPVHGKGPDTPDINCIFAAPKLKRTPCSMGKSILGAWINVRPGLTKEDSANRAELLRQPLFRNPSLTNSRGMPLGVNGQSEGCAFARSGHSRIRDLWNREAQEWKNLSDLGMHFHASNKASKDIIIESIHRRPDSFSSWAQPGDWVSNSAP
jgi:hypothetical protein